MESNLCTAKLQKLFFVWHIRFTIPLLCDVRAMCILNQGCKVMKNSRDDNYTSSQSINHTFTLPFIYML